ncbi:ABC transporter ATP-binding protein [Anaerospora sp.]|uniref:ABC transporter ATP-binding protein n=1 Tax=Anaerospora sp. TaxID=1960278 RepID=UPI0028977175|nr:ABC transporter ATP-binding protein [Anaerospora sp.]
MIEIAGLVKKFGDRTAVDKLDLSIPQGELFGLLGPNGAGKTTTIRVLTMLAQPTEGRITIGGLQFPGDEQQIKTIIGVVPQHINLDIELTAWENLELHGRLHGIPTDERHKRIEELLEFVELKDRCQDMVQTFSGGMKRRLMIARALLHRPKVLFLDEPTVGLDPQVRRRLWELVRRLAGEGLTVLLTTHYIEEAENLCQRVAIMYKGKLIALDSPAKLCQNLGEYVVEWHDGDRLNSRFFTDRTKAADFVGVLTTAAAIRRSNLEDVFVEFTGRKVVE